MRKIRMQVASEADIRKLVESDERMMHILKIAKSLNLPDWWIGAGFLRNRVWDAMSNNEPRPESDIDLVYFDSGNPEKEADYEIEEELKSIDPSIEWEVRNQVHMHPKNGNKDPYTSTEDAIAHWPETATAIGVRLNENDALEFLFCYGTEDLFALIARPTPYFTGDHSARFYERLNEKNWQKRWPRLKVEKE